MKNIFKIVVLIGVLSSSVYSSDYFLDISTGYTYTPYTKKDISGSIETSDLDENGYLYDLAFAYKINERIFTTINYQYSKLDEIDYDDFYLTLNYQFNQELKPYVGALIGMSYLHWNKDPLNNSQEKDKTSRSFMYGVQAGLEYAVTDNISFVPRVIYSRTNHGTTLISAPAKSYIEHDSKAQLLLGFRYRF